ncbi:MAG: DEAD/DEAH box helicase [Candidatus Micrarchaeia archaeon]
MNNFSEIVQENLDKMGFKKLTAVQEKAIPRAFQGRSFWARSPTGTGKTAAFIIPLVERAIVDSSFRVLVLEPSRELAIQAANECRKIAQGAGVLTVAAYGGTDVDRQVELLEKGAQIIIGTTGRVRELIEKHALKPQGVRVLVLDEADRLLSEQFEKKTLFLVKALPQTRQTMFFSVQASPSLLKKAEKFTESSLELVKVGTVSQSTIKHEFVVTEKKGRKLAEFLKKNARENAMVFCATVEEVEALSKQLYSLGEKALLLHSRMRSKRRHSAIRRFKQGEVGVLIATDVAARGMHFDDVKRVYSIGLPSSPEFYLHRAGRTGRMHKKGVCTSIVSKKQVKDLLNIYASQGITAIEK